MSLAAPAARLRHIGAALGLTIDDTQAARLSAHLDLLQRWNATYNLTAIRDPETMLTQHLADCLAAVQPLVRQLSGAHARLLDVGSGGGLPGVVLAIMLPQLDVSCIDAVGKKAAFVRQVAAELRLRNLEALHGRVEHVTPPAFDVVASRAFSSLPDFVGLTSSALKADGVWMAMKGKPPADEMAALPAEVGVFHVEQLSVPDLAAKRCLVWMRRSPGAARPNL